MLVFSKEVTKTFDFMMNKWIILIALWFSSTALIAGEVKIVDAKAHFVESTQDWNFAVTLQHEDTGWDHYANEWRVLTSDGKVLGSRVLYHPHVKEQPFTRSLQGVKIPESLDVVFIQAQDTGTWHQSSKI